MPELHSECLNAWETNVPTEQIREPFRKWVGCHKLVTEFRCGGADIEFEILQGLVEEKFPGRTIYLNDDSETMLLIDKYPDAEVTAFVKDRIDEWEENGSFDQDKFHDVFSERCGEYWHQAMSITDRIRCLQIHDEPLALSRKTNIYELPEGLYEEIHSMLMEMLD